MSTTGYRHVAIQLFRRGAKLIPYSVLQRIYPHALICPLYHVVADHPTPHISPLYRAKNSAEFEQDLDHMLKHYEPIDYATLRKLDPLQKVSKPRMLLSFDDGLREFHDVVAPILKRKGIPAINFLNNRFIDNQGLFYRYKAALLISAVSENPDLLNKLDTPELSLSHFEKQALSTGYLDSMQLDNWATQMDIDFDAFLQQYQPYMSSSMIESLKGQGFEFGAHSLNHPMYQELTIDQQVEQTRKSVEDLVERFGLPYKIFAFPFTDHGIGKPFFERIEQEQMLHHSFGCAGMKSDIIPHHLQRIPLEMDGLSAKEILSAEMLYSGLRKLMGRDSIKRL